ncbi:hypothetical protein GCM10027256_22000 [Novispirillum itersonii subsp. nipponicum]
MVGFGRNLTADARRQIINLKPVNGPNPGDSAHKLFPGALDTIREGGDHTEPGDDYSPHDLAFPLQFSVSFVYFGQVTLPGAEGA